MLESSSCTTGTIGGVANATSMSSAPSGTLTGSSTGMPYSAPNDAMPAGVPMLMIGSPVSCDGRPLASVVAAAASASLP